MTDVLVRPLFFAVTGQSLATGVGSAWPMTRTGSRANQSLDVFVFDNTPAPGDEPHWVNAGPEDALWPWPNTINCFGYHFCLNAARETGRQVFMIKRAVSGQPIKEMLPAATAGGTEIIWAGLISAWRNAVDAPLPGRNGATLRSIRGERLDGIVVQQGEGDRDAVGTTPAQYRARMGSFRSQWETRNAIRPEAPVIWGQTIPGGSQDDRSVDIEYIAKTNPGFATVSLRGIETHDGLHPYGDGLVEIGKRHWLAYDEYRKGL